MSKKKIITAPHKTLRLEAKVIDELDKSVKQFLRSLQQTLVAQEKPAAAGLALPQIDLSYRAFATYLETPTSTHPQARIFVNPVIIDLSDVLSVGPDSKSSASGRLVFHTKNYIGPLPGRNGSHGVYEVLNPWRR